MSASTPPNEVPIPPMSLFKIIVYTLFGVLLPIVALTIEIAYGLSAQIYFNPIPGPLQVALIGFVPLSLAVHLYRSIRRKPLLAWELPVNSFSIGIAALYTLVYLPITHFGFFGILVYGIGLLPLSPLLALASAASMRRRLKRRGAAQATARRVHFWRYAVAAILLIALAYFPLFFTIYSINRYAQLPDVSAKTIALLRSFGSEKHLLEACYGGSNSLMGDFFDSRIEMDEARKLYYRVTGRSFNMDRRPRTFLGTRGGGRDLDLGGERVGQRVDHLFLSESRLDGITYPEHGAGYAEWTLLFKNQDFQNHEARMLISLPEGGVVSRVTLWVNGEPREAAFGSKAKVRAAYQQVAVRQRRDPILVNWAGPDIVLAQCFPVPANGEMKVRLGISFPLQYDAEQGLYHRYPAIIAQNFDLVTGLNHSVWIEHKVNEAVLKSPPADLSTSQLLGDRVQLPPEAGLAPGAQAYPPSGKLKEAQTLVARLPTPENDTHQPAAAVMDGSISMAGTKHAIAKWLSKIDGPITIYFAGDEVSTFSGTGPSAAKWLLRQRFIGGQDNAPALSEALRALLPAASTSKRQSIYWFNGPQPIALSDTSKIQQVFERRDPGIDIVNCISSRDYNALHELAPLSFSETRYLQDDGTLSSRSVEYISVADVDAMIPTTSANHPYRIWLAHDIRRLARELYNKQSSMTPGAYKNQLNALALRAASAYLVTQLSGAVVLEEDRQYKENDLEAGDPNHVPSIPENKHFALILSLLAFSIAAARRDRYRFPRTTGVS